MERGADVPSPSPALTGRGVAASPSTRRLTLTGVLTAPALWLAVALLLLGWHQFWLNSRDNLGGWGVDDAWITFRYSHNLADGLGPVWNAGEQVEGYTNFLWMVIIAGAIKLGAGGIGVSILLGAAAAMVALLLTYRLAETGLWRGRLPLVSAAITLLLAVDGSFATWSIAGLETSFYTMLLVGGVLLLVMSWERESDSPPLEGGAGGGLAANWLSLGAGSLFVLAAMTRPEALYALALGGAFRLYGVWRRRRIVRADVYYVLPLLLLYLPYFAWRWAYYGWLLPNTFYTKVGGGPRQIVDWLRCFNVADSNPADPSCVAGAQFNRGMKYQTDFVRRHSELLFFLPFVALATQRISRRLLYLTLLVAGYWFYIVYVGGDWDWAVGRFFVPLLPLILVLNADAVRGIYDAVVGRFGQRISTTEQRSVAVDDGRINPAPTATRNLQLKLVIFGVIVLLTLSYFVYERTSRNGEAPNLNYYQGVAAALYANARWIDANSQPGDLIATTAAGVLPFYSDRRYLDVLGLTDEHIAHVSVGQMGFGRAGHEKTDIPYVLAQKPAYVVLTISPDEWLGYAEFQRDYQLDESWTQDAGYRKSVFVYRRIAP